MITYDVKCTKLMTTATKNATHVAHNRIIVLPLLNFTVKATVWFPTPIALFATHLETLNMSMNWFNFSGFRPHRFGFGPPPP